VHLRGAFLGCRAVIPAMRRLGGGRIVNISSTSHLGNFGQANYAAAKGGVASLTRTVALEEARHGIAVNAVAPGTVDTPMLATVPSDVLADFREAIPMKR